MKNTARHRLIPSRSCVWMADLPSPNVTVKGKPWQNAIGTNYPVSEIRGKSAERSRYFFPARLLGAGSVPPPMAVRL